MPFKITKQEAQEIAVKLKARIRESDHTICIVFDEQGKVLAHFGIKHGSNKDAGHGWIPRSLKCTPKFAYELAKCYKYLEDYWDLRRPSFLP